MLKGVGLEIDDPRCVHLSDLSPTEGPVGTLSCSASSAIGPILVEPRRDKGHRLHPITLQQGKSNIIEIPRSVIEGQYHSALRRTTTFL
jgi:hypothetical protein